MQVRFRILKGSSNSEPQAVSEGTASLEQLRTLIAGGDLKLKDLVNVGNGWETLEDCQALAEVVASVRRSKFPLKRILWLWLIAVILSIILSVSLFLTT